MGEQLASKETRPTSSFSNMWNLGWGESWNSHWQWTKAMESRNDGGYFFLGGSGVN